MSQTQFSDKTRCIVYGLQARPVQGMLDFDFMCKRKKPSVAAMVYPFQGAHYSKFYWGTEETLVPVYPSLAQACSTVWKSNFGRPTPSTRRASVATSARRRGDSTPSMRCCPRDRVGSMAWRFTKVHAIYLR